jgi:hypothetical protein
VADASLTGGFDLSFAEQIAFFRQKLNLPTERWDDIWQAAHDRAFVVAGAMKADLLNDLRQAVDKAISTGTTLETFRKDFREIVAKNGWTGWTGEGTPGGFNWRTRVIYETNLRSSYAAGRWAQLTDPRLKALRPYWRYVHNDSVLSPRQHHKAWGDMRLTLPQEHPFWKTHFPPNGWGCRCRVTAVAAPKANDATEPPEGWDVADETGKLPGIDKGWAYAPGSSDMTLRQMVQDKVINYPPAISKALSRDVNRYINAQQDVAEYVTRVIADRSKAEPLWLGFVDNFETVSEAAGRDVKGFMILLPDDAPRHVERSHGHDGGDQRPPSPADFAQIATVLTQADRIEPGHPTGHDLPSVVAWKEIEGELYRAVFEVRTGKANRALTLLSLIIKTAGGS